MPGVMPIYEPDAKDDDERKDRVADIDRHWKLRDGDHKKPLKVKNNQDENIILNVSGQIIDDIVEFLGVPELTVESGGDAETKKLLKQISDANEFKSMVADTIESGLVAGHTFMRIAPADDDDNPIVAPLDQRFCSVFWDISQPGLKRATLWYRITWQAEETVWRQDIVPVWLIADAEGNRTGSRRDVDLGWKIIQYVKRKGKSEFEFDGDEAWDFPFAPIVDWKNRRRPHHFYGWSELAANAEALQNAINFIASNTGKIIKYHAHPKTALIGATLDNIKVDTGVDRLIEIPAGGDIKNLEMQADLSSSMKYQDMLEKRYFAERRVVDPTSVKDKAGALTNFGLRTMYLNMEKLIAEKQDFYGSGIVDAMQRALAVAGQPGVKLKAVWTDPLPKDRLEVVNAASAEKDIGTTSLETLATDLERNYLEEKKKIANEKSEAIDQNIATMARMGEAGMTFGNPATNGGQGQEAAQNGREPNGTRE